MEAYECSNVFLIFDYCKRCCSYFQSSGLRSNGGVIHDQVYFFFVGNL